MALLAHGLNAVLLLVMWAFALWAFERLPDPFPIHFDAAGNPNGWSEKSLAAWLIAPGTALGLTVLTYASVLFVPLARRYPGLINLPGRYRARFLALPPERRESVFGVVKAFTYWLAVPMNVLLAWIEWSTYHAAFDGRMSGSVWSPIVVFLVLFTAIVTVGIVWMLRAVDRA